MRRSASLLLACFCFPSVLPAAGDTAWQVHLDRPAAVGDRAAVSSTGRQSRKITNTSPTQPTEISDETLKVEYSAVHEVLAVDTAGRASSMRLTVERLITDDGSGPQEQFAPGTLITATADGDRTRYQLGRNELEGTLSDALDLAGARLQSSNVPPEDAVFLNHTARRPGDRWMADPKRLADAIAATSPFLIDPVTSTGEILFEEVLTEQNIPALSTTTIFKIDPVAIRQPSHQRFSGSSINSTTQRIFPIDPALPVLRETLETKMKLVQRASSGPQPAGTETLFSREVTRRCLPLPAAGKGKNG